MIDKDTSPNTSTAKSSRRDSLNDRITNTHNSPYSESDQSEQVKNHQQLNLNTTNPPIQSLQNQHMMAQPEIKHDLPVRTSKK